MTITKSKFISKNGFDNSGNTLSNVGNPLLSSDAVNLNWIDNNVPQLTQNEVISGIYTFTNGIITSSVDLGGGAPLTGGSLSNITQTANIRQSVITGPVNLTTLRPSFLEKSGTTGQINLVNVTTDTPLTISFANGFGPNADKVSSVTTTSTDILPYATPNSNSQRYYLYADYATDSTVSFNYTLVQPQYGAKYSTPSQARLRFTGTDDLVYSTGDGRTLLRDNYGNIWVKPAKSNVSFANTGYVGERSALFDDNPGLSVLDCSDIDNVGNGPWTIGFHFKMNGSIPTSGVQNIVTASTQASTTSTTGWYGASLALVYTAGGVQLRGWISNTGTSNDIANAVTGTAWNMLRDHWYYFALCFTGSAYYMGHGSSGSTITWELLATSNLKVCPINRMTFGQLASTTATTPQFQIDDFYFMRYSKYTGGTDTAKNTTDIIEGDYFNIPSMKMYSLSGDGINMVNGTVSKVDATTNTLSGDAYHNFSGGERVVFDNLGYAMSLPTGLSSNTVYYVIENSVLSDGISFQVASTSSSQTPVDITGTVAAGTSYTVSAPMERQWTYHRPYYNSLDNTIDYRDIPHGLDFGEIFWFWSSTPGGLQLNRNGYLAVPCSENKLRLATDLTGISNTPAVINSWSDSSSLNNSTTGSGTKVICYGDGYYVGKFISFYAGTTGTSYTYSSDGIKWTIGNFPASKTWVHCIFDDTKFVVLSSDGYTITSTDGINWSALSASRVAVETTFSRLVYGDGVYLAYATSGNLYKTSDVTTSWTLSIYFTLFPGNQFSFAYNGQYFIAIPYTQNTSVYYYATSSTMTWNTGALPSSQYWGRVAYGNGKFVVPAYQSTAAGTTTIAVYSNDGITWSNMTLPTAGYWYGASFYNGVFVITAVSGNTVLTSATGTTWVNQGATTNPISSSSRVAGGNGVLVLTSASNVANNVSYNYGASWESNILPIVGAPITYGKGIYVSNNGNGILKSYDAVNWSLSLSTALASTGASAYGSGVFVMLQPSASTSSWSSSDGGDTWTARTMPASLTYNCVAYGNGKFVAGSLNGIGGALGTITQSTGVVTWTAISMMVTSTKGVYFVPNRASATLPGLFVQFGTSTACYLSIDGESWYTASSPMPGIAASGTRVAAGGAGILVVASATSGTVMVSFVGTTLSVWTTVTGVLAFTSPSTVGVTYRNGLFVAVSAAGVSYSNDGITWTSYSTGLPSYVTSMTVHAMPTIGNGNLVFNAGNTVGSSVIAIAQVGPNSSSYNLTLTDSNFRTVTTIPNDNLIQKTRVYVGQINNGTITPYSYRGEYLSDWFPVTTNTTFFKYHNIGTGAVTTDVFFNKFRSDIQSYEIDACNMMTSAGTNQSFGCQTMSIDESSIALVTGITALDYKGGSVAWNYTSGDFGSQTSGYYKIHVVRSW